MTHANSLDAKRSFVPHSYHTSRKKDILWIMCLSFESYGTPMWAGWNSVLEKIGGTIQKISYLPQINMSPTSYAVVKETLKRSLTIAEETSKSSIAVTFDLAIAKIAMQIQHEESPTYDKIFINLGGFHIEMAYFNAIGKYIDESGGPYILIEAEVLASGSLKGFIKGKDYNRCKRLHPLLSATLDMDALSRELFEFLDLYQNYILNTVNGSHGATAKFWINYVQMLHLYHEFSSSIRTGDLDLYVNCLPRLSIFFFVFNQPNYARWIIRYHDNLLRLKDTHPQVEEEFREGGFSVKRTRKSFSKSAVDLTLEQTINANAASQKTGINAFTNSISARQRWAHSHSLSVAVLSHLME